MKNSILFKISHLYGEYMIVFLLFCWCYFALPWRFNLLNQRKSLSYLRSNIKNDHPIKDFENTYDLPPFFPSNTLELAQDTAYSVKIGLIHQWSRLRIDIHSKHINRPRNMMNFLLLFANQMIDEDIETIYLFLNSIYDVKQYNQEYQTLLQSGTLNRISESMENNIKIKIEIRCFDDENLDDNKYGDYKKTKSLFIIAQPNNIYCKSDNQVLEHIQRLCFHSALRAIPVVMINPNLIATCWNNYGARQPLLLSDFGQVYVLRDDYMQLNRKDRWCGMIYRFSAGLDVYILNGYPNYHPFPISSVRVRSWKDKYPCDMAESMIEVLTNFPNLITNHRTQIFQSIFPSSSSSPSSSSMASDLKRNRPLDIFMSMESDMPIEYSKFSWRNIKPAPKSS